MGFEFRLTECVLVLIAIVCFFMNNPQCLAGQQTKKKPKFHYIKGILPLLKDGKPRYHDAVLDWNLTNQLSASRYMLNLYKSLNTVDDNSESFNVSNFTTTKSVQGADTIMGILNDGKFSLCEYVYICYSPLSQINKNFWTAYGAKSLILRIYLVWK